MASNILFLPFRRSVHVTLSDAIKSYISNKYDQHPDMFAADLKAMDELRHGAVHALEPHPSGVRKLQQYAAQLIWIGGKFPVDIGVDFPWYPALGYNTTQLVAQDNLRFELANILFNLAAMYSQLAMATNRTTSEGLKIACNYFCFGAGVLSYIKTEVVPDMRSTPPEDMDSATLESLEHLMLAQAQECFWQKAVKDGLKDASIAKLAATVSDLYSDAGDLGVKSDAISSEWMHHMSAKHHHFAAAAQYRAACDCLEKRKYGEEVARLRDSLACINVGLKETRYINKTVVGDMNGLRERVQEDLKRAEKDNDMIYLLPVPSKQELKILDRAVMVSAKVPKEVSDATSLLGEHSELGRPLFAKLVPYSVHVAASIYADRRDRQVSQIVEDMEAMTAKLHELLKSLNLPGSLQALEKPLGLPPGLVSHAEEIRQQDGINRLHRAIEETAKLKAADGSIYQEGVALLQSEAAEDDQARRKYGTDRWSRPTPQEAVPKLFRQIGEIEAYLKQAASSDETVQKKLKEFEKLIRLLGGSDYDLEHFVPSARRVTMSPAVDREASRLRTSLNEVNRLESRRRRKIEALRAKAKQDDVHPALIQEAARLERELPMQTIEAVQFEDLFNQRLASYDVDRNSAQAENDEQSEIETRLSSANSAFVAARKGDGSTKEREKALQSLENAYFKYKEIISNLDAGRKFYNDLAKIVGRFRDDCRTFAYQRKAEASELEQEITTSSHLASLNLNSNTASLQQQRQSEVNQPPYTNAAPAQQPIAAPQPSRPGQGPAPVAQMWSPDMGIRFSGVATPADKNVQTSPQKAVDGRWDPSKGLNFGGRTG